MGRRRRRVCAGCVSGVVDRGGGRYLASGESDGYYAELVFGGEEFGFDCGGGCHCCSLGI